MDRGRRRRAGVAGLASVDARGVATPHLKHAFVCLQVVGDDLFDRHEPPGGNDLWSVDDPYRFRIHGIEELGNPDLCLAYPRRDFPADAVIPEDAVIRILRCFRDLRFMDETIYLRSGMLNIFNGLIGLTFSCDGSHYMPWQEFLDKSLGFWLGTSDEASVCV